MEEKQHRGLGTFSRAAAVLLIAKLAVDAVNHISALPFISAYRAYTHLYTEKGTVGPYAALAHDLQVSEPLAVHCSELPEATVTFFSPLTESAQKSAPLPVIVYIHGGGWCTGRAAVVEPFVRTLAGHGYLVANVEYALAPEVTWPQPLQQLCYVLTYIRAHAAQYGGDPDRIFVGGNSAGAHYSACIGALMTDADLRRRLGIEQPIPRETLAGVLLFNGVYNLKTAGSCGYPYFDLLAWGLTGRRDYENDPRIQELSPVNYITASYPPTYITVGDHDPLEPQTIEMVKALEDCGAAHTALLWTGSKAGLPHDYIFRLDRKEPRDSLELLLEFLQKHSGNC